MAEDDYTRAFGFGNGFPFMPFMGHGPRIPQRHQRWEGPGPSRRRDAADEVRFHPGAQVPDMGHMSADEYAAFIRDGFNRRRHRQDMDDMEGRREARRTEARKLEIDEQVERERQERKAQKQKREKAVNEEENCKAERRKWRARCAALMDGEVVSVNLKFSDIPWPVYTATSSQDVSVVVTPEDLTVDKVRVFLNALATDESKGADSKSVEDSRRKVLRDAIRQFHPDRFFSRVLPRVREPDQDKVKEGVERTSRLINELFSNDK
jgi:hypothetical protein